MASINEIKEKPTQGFLYITRKDQSVAALSKIAGVTEKDTLNANPWLINRSKEKHPTFYIFPGEEIIIPLLNPAKRPELEFRKPITLKKRTETTLVIEDKEIPLMTGSFTRIFNSMANGFESEIAWKKGADTQLDKVTDRFQPHECQLYLGEEKALDGWTTNIIDNNDNRPIKKISGYSRPIFMINSALLSDYTIDGAMLENRIKHFAWPFQVDFKIDDEAKKLIGVKIKRAGGKAKDLIGAHLIKLAKQRSLILTDDADGNIVVTVSKSDGEIVTPAIYEDKEFRNTFKFMSGIDQLQRAQVYKVLGQSKNNVNSFAVAKDPSFPFPVVKVSQANENDDGDLQKTANFQLNSQIAKALENSYPVPTWYTSEGTTWPVNKLIRIESETLGTNEDSKFSIQEVVFNFESTDAVLKLVPDWSYSTKKLKLPERVRDVSLADIEVDE